MIKAAVFDMDGTILNTIGDLTDSLNYALVETGHKGGHPEEMVKLCFGWALNLDMIKALAMAKGFSAKDLELAGNKIPVEDIPATEEEIMNSCAYLLLTMEAITKSKRNLTAVYLKLFAPSGKRVSAVP